MTKSKKLSLRKYRKQIIVAVSVIILAIIGLSSLINRSSLITVDGTLTLGDFTKFGNMKAGDSCEGTGGYDDINRSTQVVAKDGNDILAITSLGAGSADSTGNCLYSFTLNNIDKKDFYSFEVSHRGVLNFSYDELKDQDYKVDFTLGEVEKETVTSNGSVEYIALPNRTDALKSIKEEASKKWKEDYSMVQYEIEKQTDAYDWLVSKQNDNPKILQWSIKKWNNDFDMVKYEYENQLEAFNNL